MYILYVFAQTDEEEIQENIVNRNERAEKDYESEKDIEQSNTAV
jgi:hypothetical protein